MTFGNRLRSTHCTGIYTIYTSKNKWPIKIAIKKRKGDWKGDRIWNVRKKKLRFNEKSLFLINVSVVTLFDVSKMKESCPVSNRLNFSYIILINFRAGLYVYQVQVLQPGEQQQAHGVLLMSESVSSGFLFLLLFKDLLKSQ